MWLKVSPDTISLAGITTHLMWCTFGSERAPSATLSMASCPLCEMCWKSDSFSSATEVNSKQFKQTKRHNSGS